jgi:hypothetical protein
MNKILKRILLTLLAAVLLFIGCVLFISYLATRSPEAMTRAVQQQLKDQLSLPVTIASTRLEWKQGPRVILNRVNIDSPGVINLHIQSVTAYLGIWRLLFGDVSVKKVRLVAPSGEIDLDNLQNLKLKKGTAGRPVVIIWKGSVKFIYQGLDFPLTDLSGRITNDWINLRARSLGGRVLLEADLVKPGKVTFDAYGIPLKQIDTRFKGTANMSFTIEDLKNSKAGSFSLQAKDLSLPYIRGTMKKLVVSAALSGDRQRMSFTDISIKTPLVEVSGKGEILGLNDMGSWKDAVLSLDASSSEFDYEKLVSVLPVNLFPDWLKTLLTKQIRSGRSRFSTARYKGPIKEFLSGEALMNNLYVVQDLYGQSFGAGYSADRVTGITGQVTYTKGDIRLNNLSGFMGRSSLKKVDIVFTQVVKPLLRVAVDVDLDMPAADFISTWRAAMVPQDIYKLLSPVSKVKGGLVHARMRTSYNETLKSPFYAMEDIKIENCTYTWGNKSISGQSGSIRADSYSAPHHIMFTGTFDSTRIKKLDVSLLEPFGKNRSRFFVLADHLRPAGTTALGDASIKLTGTGTGADLKGSLELSTPGITYAASNYTITSQPASAKGNFTTRLESQPLITVNDMVIRTPTSSLGGSASIKSDTGSLALSGELHLKDLSCKTAKGLKNLDGLVNGSMKISWDNAVSAEGNLRFSNMVLPYQENSLTINGPVTFGTHVISSDALQIASGDTTIVLNGKLSLEKQPYFKGSAVIDGMKTGEGGMTLKGLTDLRADATLKFVNCVFYGLPIEGSSAQAEFKDGILSLTHVDMETVSGSAKGTIRIAADGASTYDLMISIKGADMRKLLRATQIKSIIDGRLDMDGHVSGHDDSINGTLIISARDGEIRKYELVSQIFSLLNVYKIFQNRDIDFISNHFTYNHLTATLDITDNVVSFDDFALDSNSIQLSAVGKYSLKTKKIDANIGVQPLESVDWTVSKIPLVGWVLTGDKGKLIVVNMSLKGTMSDPKVRLEPIETLSNTVAASLLRSLKLPARLINESLKYLEKKGQ